MSIGRTRIALIALQSFVAGTAIAGGLSLAVGLVASVIGEIGLVRADDSFVWPIEAVDGIVGFTMIVLATRME